MSTYLYDIHLNFRYRTCFKEGVPCHSGKYRVYIHPEMRTWHDNNIQSLYFPRVIKIAATMIHYCYCLIAYEKSRPIIWYRMINITLYFSACLKLLGIFFNLKLYAGIEIFTKILCIWKIVFLKELFLEEVHFNVYI